jgi:hypothetical protein
MQLWLHLDPKFRSHVLENNGDRLDDELVWMSLAVLDNFVLGLPRLLDVEVMLAREAVVPAAIPGREKIGVSLPRSSQLCARQLLNIQIAVGVSVRAQIGLRMS